MPTKVVVLYPNSEGATFDMKYYQSTHMPLVGEHWQQYGLQGWEVLEFQPSPDGAKPQYSVQATLTFESPESVQKAMNSEEAKTVLGDIPNFANTQPTLLGAAIKETITL